MLLSISRALLLLLIAHFCITQPVLAAPLKPFHLRFDKYEQNPADGTYTFHFQFPDLPRPQVIWPGDPGPKTTFKIGDTIGQYKIVSFTLKHEPLGPLDDTVTPYLDKSELLLQNLTKPDEKIAVRFRETYNLFAAGIPLETK